MSTFSPDDAPASPQPGVIELSTPGMAGLTLALAVADGESDALSAGDAAPVPLDPVIQSLIDYLRAR